MYYIGRLVSDNSLIDHTMSDDKMTTLLAMLQYQMHVVKQNGLQHAPAAYDYPVVDLKEVSVDQYQRAKSKDLDHFNRLLV